ncbi:MAG: alpha/beta hydrolase [Pseudomonadota bacterium]
MKRAIPALVVATFAAPLQASENTEHPATQFLNRSDVVYAYRTYGPETGRPLILSHRFRANLDDWDPAFLAEISENRPVVTFNSVGVSTSSGNVPTDIEGMADSMAEFIRGLGYEKADILGWSMGGFVVQELATRHSELVDRLILVGTGPGGSPKTPAPVEGVFAVATEPEYNADHRAYLFFADAPSSLSRAEASIERIDANRDPSREPATTVAVMQNQAAAIEAYFSGANGAFGRLGAISAPTLILAGDRDPFFPVAGALLLHREIPNSRLSVAPMTGHGPHHQWPEHSAKLIDDFLADTASVEDR